MKADEKVAVSITLEPQLLAEIDARAGQLDLNRSQYLRRVAREDLEKNIKAAIPNSETQPQEVAA